MIPLDSLINDEQLLDFALSHICEKNTNEVHEVAEKIVTLYIINRWEKEGKTEFTEEEVCDKFSELVADYVLGSLVRKGLVDVDFDDKGELWYNVTDLGQRKIKE